MTESEKTAKQKEKEAKKKAEKEAKLEKLRLKQQKQEEAKKAKESKVCSLSTFSCTNSPNQFGCFIFSLRTSFDTTIEGLGPRNFRSAFPLNVQMLSEHT